MRRVIKNGFVLENNEQVQKDIAVEDGKIVEISDSIDMMKSSMQTVN